MSRKIRWLEASYLIGAVADFGIGILVLIPGRTGQTTVTYPMGLTATMMFGWSLLLIWAYRKPVERKGILVITIFPVITGLMAANLYALAAGIFTVGRVIPAFIFGIGLIALMGYSYFNARNLKAEN